MTPNIVVRLGTQVVGGRGSTRLETLTVCHAQTGTVEDVPAAAVFILIGAEPRTDWLASVVSLDQDGFVLTGQYVPRTGWPLAREPYPFETSSPGVFAVDVRYGSVKRIAGAVGEGSVAVGSIHRYLAEAEKHPGPAPEELATGPATL